MAALVGRVLAVPRGNPKNVRSLDDVTEGDVRFVQADPNTTANNTTRLITRDKHLLAYADAGHLNVLAC